MTNVNGGSKVPVFTLNNGLQMPGVGIGCWLGAEGNVDGAEEMCRNALKNGYRHIDTASGYRTEDMVGKAVRESGIARDQIFITTKLWNADHHRVREACDESLARLNCGYIDLYLMHWPQAEVNGRVLSMEESPTFIDTWKEMEKLVVSGRVKSIGLSNFSIKTLDILLPHCTIMPVTNQVQVHPCLPEFELQRYCESRGIILTAWSPFGSGNSLFFSDPDFVRVVDAHQATAGQVALSWLLQRGIAVVPKSANVDRMRSNLNVIELTSEEMDVINAIHKKPGMHRSLIPWPYGAVAFGWTYEQLGWPRDAEGVVMDAAQ